MIVCVAGEKEYRHPPRHWRCYKYNDWSDSFDFLLIEVLCEMLMTPLRANSPHAFRIDTQEGGFFKVP